MWKRAYLPKFIQFGKDGQGEHSHALNGPAFKAVWRHKTLLIQTIKHMEPVYELLESKRLVYRPSSHLPLVRAQTRGRQRHPRRGGSARPPHPPRSRAKRRSGASLSRTSWGKTRRRRLSSPRQAKKLRQNHALVPHQRPLLVLFQPRFGPDRIFCIASMTTYIGLNSTRGFGDILTCWACPGRRPSPAHREARLAQPAGSTRAHVQAARG